MTDAPAEAVRNVLFIMCDQLRWDALSCSGADRAAPTPNIDRLAARGVRFDRAYVQGAVCGSSRMSFYTGRYVFSHGARRNQVPLEVNQRTLGDHLQPLGVRNVLILRGDDPDPAEVPPPKAVFDMDSREAIWE